MNHPVHTVTVDLGERRYPILIGASALQTIGLGERRALIVTDDHVAAHWLTEVQAQLPRAGSLVLPAGESNKTLSTAASVLDHLADHGFHRDCVLVALGGGVIGDITGFAAACWHRGVDFIQIPTTLLAMVDSSVGGKTGVNHPAGKNLIGAFHQPLSVHADLTTLTTLPDREYIAGLAEVAKYALLGDVDFLAWLEHNTAGLMARDSTVLTETVARCCQAKADIVAQDERETGRRALLNLGHTFGHAIETGTGHGTWLHGEAVAAGMVMAAALSADIGWLSSADVQRCRALLSGLRLPVQPPQMPANTFQALMMRDKKVRAGKLHLVLLKSLGKAVLTDTVSADALGQFLQGALPESGAA